MDLVPLGVGLNLLRVRDPRLGAFVGLDELQKVAIVVLDVGHGDRPALQLGRGHDRLAADGDGPIVKRLAVAGVDVQLPKGVSHVDRCIISEFLSQLEAAASMGRLQDGFLNVPQIGTANEGDANGLLPKVHGPVDVAHIYAVLREDGYQLVSLSGA